MNRRKTFVLYSRQQKKYQGKSPLKRGLNDMTSLPALLCNWPLVGQFRERINGMGLRGNKVRQE